jgi:ABC-2 type transport system permease protein
MGRLKTLGTLVLKDWQLFRSDRRALILAFIVPIVLASLFGLIFDRPARGLLPGKVQVIIVPQESEEAPTAFARDLSQHPRLNVTLMNRAEAESALLHRRASVALVLEPQDKVMLLHHPLCAVECQCVEGILAEWILRRKAGEILKPLGLTADSMITHSLSIPKQTIPAETGHPFNSYSHSFSGMTLQYLLFWGMESGLLFLRERQRGIWRRLRSCPVPLWCIVLSRGISTAGVALVQVLLTFAFGAVVFGVSITGSPIGFFCLALAIGGLSAAAGMMVAALGGTESRARPICILVILIVSLLGGLWMPTFLLPGWTQELALALPTTWAMHALDGLTWQGMTFAGAFASVGMVWLFVLGLLGCALILLYRQEKHRLLGFSY